MNLAGVRVTSALFTTICALLEAELTEHVTHDLTALFLLPALTHRTAFVISVKTIEAVEGTGFHLGALRGVVASADFTVRLVPLEAMFTVKVTQDVVTAKAHSEVLVDWSLNTAASVASLGVLLVPVLTEQHAPHITPALWCFGLHFWASLLAEGSAVEVVFVSFATSIQELLAQTRVPIVEPLYLTPLARPDIYRPLTHFRYRGVNANTDLAV
jgi:hypothetical protein